MENNCTILMKILCCSPNEIEAVKDNFSKRKKKKNNFFSGIFAKNWYLSVAYLSQYIT